MRSAVCDRVCVAACTRVAEWLWFVDSGVETGAWSDGPVSCGTEYARGVWACVTVTDCD